MCMCCSLQCIRQDNIHIALYRPILSLCLKSLIVSKLLLHKMLLAYIFSLGFAFGFGGGIHVRFCNEFIFHPGITLFGMSEGEVRKRCS